MTNFFKFFENVGDKEKVEAVDRLVRQSSPRRDFFLMVILSVSMATFGIMLDSVVILIGSMLIAPVLYPVIGLAMGIVMDDRPLISRSFLTLFKSVVYALVAAISISVLFIGVSTPDQPVIIKSISDINQSLIMYLAVAVIAGVAASFAMIKPNLNETLPGVAVTVSLVPPLAAIGYGISKLDWSLVTNFSLVFLVNIAGIIFSSFVIFAFFDFQKKQKVADRSIKKDEKILMKENH